MCCSLRVQPSADFAGAPQPSDRALEPSGQVEAPHPPKLQLVERGLTSLEVEAWGDPISMPKIGMRMVTVRGTSLCELTTGA